MKAHLHQRLADKFCVCIVALFEFVMSIIISVTKAKAATCSL